MARRSKKNSGGCLGSLIGLVALTFIGEAISHWQITIAIIILYIILVNTISYYRQNHRTAAARKREAITREKEKQRIVVQVHRPKNYRISRSRSIQDNPFINQELQRVDKMDGRSFEYWCADLLSKNGYVNIQVTPGSGDQGADIICERNNRKYAIQCKCYSRDLGNTPIQEVTAGKLFYECDCGIVMTNRYFTQSAIELAIKAEIQLYDRNTLVDMLYKITTPNSLTSHKYYKTSL